MSLAFALLQRCKELQQYRISEHKADIEVLGRHNLIGVATASLRMESWSLDEARAHLQWRGRMCDPQGNGLEYNTGSLGRQMNIPQTGPCLSMS